MQKHRLYFSTLKNKQNEPILCAHLSQHDELKGLLIAQNDDLSLAPGAIGWARLTKIIRPKGEGTPLVFATFQGVDDIQISVNKNEAAKLHEGQKLLIEISCVAHGQKGLKAKTNLQFQTRYFDFYPQKQREETKGNLDITNKHWLDEDQLEQIHTSLNKLSGRLTIRPALKPFLDHEIFNQALSQLADKTAILYQADEKQLINAPNFWQNIAMTMGGTDFDIDMQNWPILAQAQKEFSLYAPDLLPFLPKQPNQDKNHDHSLMIEDMDSLTKRQITMKSGGIISFDKTEALIAIDIDFARALGHISAEKLNQQAINLIAKHIVMRDLAGLIVIDVVNMQNRAKMQGLVKTLRELLKTPLLGYDKRRQDVLGLTSAGLIEVIRQRRNHSFADQVKQLGL